MASSLTAALSSIAAGAATYWGYFHHGEHFLNPYRPLQMFIVTVLAGAIFLTNSSEATFKAALAETLRLGGLFLLGLYTNLVIYRLFLNPLNRFPGPYWARLSKFDHVFRNAKFNGHLVALKNHEKYGKFMRIGPNDLSVVDADGIEVISAPNSKCTKGPWYDGDAPRLSLHTTRDRGLHDRRRRIWAPAFSDKALRGYENRVQAINDLLVSKLDESKGSPVDATTLLNSYSFDTMGDLAFGRTFNMLQSGITHRAIKLLNEGMDPLALQFPTWFFRAVAAIPGAAKGYWEFIDFCTKQLEDRIAVHGKTDPDKPDITQTLIEHYLKGDERTQKELWPFMCGDSRLIIVAGSDTTAATLTYLFWHIASKPEWQSKLRKEVQEIKKNNGLAETDRLIPDQLLKDAPVLNGMINETLRLNPPVPSGVFRKTPKEGVMIGKTFVPGNTVIQMPQYVMSRSEDYYDQPLLFLPHRWSSEPHLIRHPNAFNPFSSGPFGCIGKNLAYMEIRTITAQIIDQFDVSLAEGEDGKKLLEGTTDHFTLGLGALRLCFVRRT